MDPASRNTSPYRNRTDYPSQIPAPTVADDCIERVGRPTYPQIPAATLSPRKVELTPPDSPRINFKAALNLPASSPTLTNDPKTNYGLILPLFERETFNWTEVLDKLSTVMLKQNYCWHTASQTWQHSNGTAISLTTIKAIVTLALYKNTQSLFQKSWNLDQENIIHSIEKKLRMIICYLPLMQTTLFFEITIFLEEYGFNWDSDFHNWYHDNGTVMRLQALIDQVEEILGPCDLLKLNLFDQAWSEHKQVCMNKIQEQVLNLLGFNNTRETEIEVELTPPDWPRINFKAALNLPASSPTLTNDPKTNYGLILPLFERETFNWTEVLDKLSTVMLKQNYCWHTASQTWQHSNGTAISLTTIKAIVTLALYKNTQSLFQKSWNLDQENIIHSIEKELRMIICYLPLMQTTLFFEITIFLKEYGFNWDSDFHNWYHDNGTVMRLQALIDQVEEILGPCDLLKLNLFDQAWSEHKQVCMNKIQEQVLDLLEFNNTRETEIEVELTPPDSPRINFKAALNLPASSPTLTNDPKTNYGLILPLFERETFNWTEVLDKLSTVMLKQNYCWHTDSQTWQHSNGTAISLTTIKAIVTLALYKNTQSLFQKSWNLDQENIIHSIEKELRMIICYLPLMQTTLFFEITIFLKEYGFNWDNDFHNWYHDNGTVMRLQALMDQVEEILGPFNPLKINLFDQAWSEHKQVCMNKIQEQVLDLLEFNNTRETEIEVELTPPDSPRINFKAALNLPASSPTLTNDPKTNYGLILPLFERETFNWTEVLDKLSTVMLKQNYCWHTDSQTWQHSNGTAISLTTIKAIVTLALYKNTQSLFQKSWNLDQENIIHSIEKELRMIICYLPLMQTTLFFEITIFLKEYGFNWDNDFHNWYHDNGTVMRLQALMDQVEEILGPFNPLKINLFDQAWSEHKQVCMNKIQEQVLDLLEFNNTRETEIEVDFSFLKSTPATPSIFSRDNYLQRISLFDQEGFDWIEVLGILFPLIQKANYYWHPDYENWHHQNGTTVSLIAMKSLIAQIIFSSTQSDFQDYWNLNQPSIHKSFVMQIKRITKNSLLTQSRLFYKINTIFEKNGFHWDVDFYLWQHKETTIPGVTLLSELQPQLDELMRSSGYIFDPKLFCYTGIIDKRLLLTLSQAWELHEHSCIKALKQCIVDLFKRQ